MAVTRNRFRFAALVLSLVLVAGACGGGGTKTNKVASDKTTTTDASSSDSSLDADTTTTGAGGVSGANGTTATTKKAGAAVTAAKPTGPGAPAASSSDPNAVPGPAREGTYGYSQSGSTPDGPVPANGTLVVSGGSTQTFKRYYDPSKEPLVLTYVFRDNGPYITGATISARGATIACNFGDGVPVPPWPPTPGKTFNGSGTCSSPAGQMTATISGTVNSRDGDLVGITTDVNAKNASNSVNVTLHDVESWSISLRVPKTSLLTF